MELFPSFRAFSSNRQLCHLCLVSFTVNNQFLWSKPFSHVRSCIHTNILAHSYMHIQTQRYIHTYIHTCVHTCTCHNQVQQMHKPAWASAGAGKQRVEWFSVFVDGLPQLPRSGKFNYWHSYMIQNKENVCYYRCYYFRHKLVCSYKLVFQRWSAWGKPV